MAPSSSSFTRQQHRRDARPEVSRRRTSSRRARSQSPAPNSSNDDDGAFPSRMTPRRAVSYPETAADANALRHRVRIQYQDEALRLRSLANVTKLMQTAAIADQSGSASPTTSEILARKALRYRNVLGRMQGVDVHDPTFDASAFLGVEWCKQTASTSPRRGSYAIHSAA